MNRQIESVSCEDGKTELRSMMNAGNILLYLLDDARWASWDSETGQIFVSRPKHWELPSGLDEHELGDSLAHEVVHKLLGHRNGQDQAETHGQDFKDKMAGCGFPQA
jgi:hypothetical protein